MADNTKCAQRPCPALPAVDLVNLSNTLSPTNSQQLQYGYDTYGNITEKYAPEIRTHLTYNNGMLTSIIEGYQNPTYSHETTITYRNGMLKEQVTDVMRGTATKYEYDSIGRVKKVEEIDTKLTAFTSDDETIRRTTTEYDDINNKITTISDIIQLGDGQDKTCPFGKPS
jgi:YD repeat-containing protein